TRRVTEANKRAKVASNSATSSSAYRPAIAYSRVGTGRTPSAVPSSSNPPASHSYSELGLIAQSYRAFSSPPLGPARAVATSQGGPPARQHQGPEGLIRNVIASIISAIAIMTNAVETKPHFGLSAKLVCGHLLVFRIVWRAFPPNLY